MSSKKSKKFVNIMLTALMLMAGSSVESYAEYGVNGVTYILMPNETTSPGVWRLNKKDGSNANPWKLFKIDDLSSKGKVSGLAANQENKVFLLTANNKSDKDFKPADPGWIPAGIKFDDDSAIYIAAATPTDDGASRYIRNDRKGVKGKTYDYNFPHGAYSESFPSDNSNSVYKFWFENATVNGVKYKYVCRFNGPKGVCLLDGDGNTIKSSKKESRYGTYGVRGTPVWDGTAYSGSNPQGAILHPKYSDSSSKHYRKIILPSHFGALSYYLYGTRNEKAIEGKCMNGEGGRDKYYFYQARCDGYWYADSKHKAGTMFACVVKRFYDKRESSLDLYSANDTTTSTTYPTLSVTSTGNLDRADVLKTIDVKVREAYGKICGDNCIDGGEISGGEVETALSTVTVVTTTIGNRYGFNPLGERYGSGCSNKIDAALRVVPYVGGEDVIDVAGDKDGKSWGGRITNKNYLNKMGVSPNSVSCIGVSSNFKPGEKDYIYGSGADYFVVQDSWWGLGGTAYEYYKPTTGKAGNVRKIEYMNKPDQDNYTDLGDVDVDDSGDLEAIGVDGNAYFYTLVTEKDPKDKTMKSLPVPTGKPRSVGGLDIEYSEWRRDKFKTVDGETVNDGFDVIADGKQKKGDYRLATIKQKIYKTVYRYSISNGTSLSTGSKEKVGNKSIEAGSDSWTNNLTCTKDGTDNVSFSFAQWQLSSSEKVSNVPCELAVVNIADSPITVPGTDKHYVVVTGAKDAAKNPKSYAAGTVYQEQDYVKFKVEGYKPKIGGIQRELQSVGDIDSPANLKGAYINNIPGETFLNGIYEHDEDKDGMSSGFPSTMFEASGKPVTVTWKIAQVEDTVAPDSISSAKVIKYLNDLPDGGIKKGYGPENYAELEYQFKDPGRYLVQATVNYWRFTNYGKASRPNDLTYDSNGSFVTKPRLITVYANALALNRTDSYITNIELKVDNNYGNPNGSVSGTSEVVPNTAGTFDTAEGEKYPGDDPARHFGKLHVSFDAQFVGSYNEGKTSDMKTNDGIGVWDYSYYRQFYNNSAKNYGLNLVDPFKEVAGNDEGILSVVNSGKHVYNYNTSGTALDSIYKVDVYNPGKEKITNNVPNTTHKAGTEVGVVKNMDKAFIQWAIYIRPISPQGDASTTDAMFPRAKKTTTNPDGGCIACGSCVDATFTPKGEGTNKYTVSFDIDDIDSKINVPRDPKSYILDFEIVYPRVTWLNNQLTTTPDGSRKDDVYYSSMVPWVDGGSSPVHVLSRLILDDSTDSWVNQNSEGIFSSSPMFALNIRDRSNPDNGTAPQYNDRSGDVNEYPLPFIESTGDYNEEVGTFAYVISDNNPFMVFAKDKVPTSVKAITTKDDAKDGLNLYLEQLRDSTINYIDTKKTYGKAKSSKDPVITIEQTCNGGKKASSIDNWYMHNDYKLSVDFVNSVKDMSTFGKVSGYKTIKEIKNEDGDAITKANWTGELKYAVAGNVYDGLGLTPSKTNVLHGLYDKELAKDVSGVYKPGEVICDGVGRNDYLQRIDNDPPSIGVTLISQNDNRKWEYQLLEGVGDSTRINTRKQTLTSELAKSKLIIRGYELQSESPLQGSDFVKEFDGTTNNYVDDKGELKLKNETALDPKKVSVPVPTTSGYVATFKHSSRMLVNVDIFDNCGYKDLEKASIKIVDKLSGDVLLDATDIDKSASHGKYGKIEKFTNKPRAVFAVDLPRKVAEESAQPQLEITVTCADDDKNERQIVIPVTIVESSFDARVLEHKENKQ